MGYEAMGAKEYPEDTETMKLLLERANMPEMHEVIDCREYKLDLNESLKAPVTCSGEHYLNLEAVVSNANNEKLKKDFHDMRRLLTYWLDDNHWKFRLEDPVRIGFMCREGRHHSVAACRIIFEVLKLSGYNAQEFHYLSQSEREPDECSSCEYCDKNDPRKVALYNLAVKVWKDEE